jgi:hypothetical protein
MVDDAGQKDIFKDHVATWEKHGDHLETLRWRNPNDSHYAIWYVRQHGMLMVFGDCYEATYMWSWDGRVNLQWISTLNLGYFLSKCRASPHGRDPSYFDYNTLRRNLKEYFDEFKNDEDYNPGPGDPCEDPPPDEDDVLPLFCEEHRQRAKEEKLFEEHMGWHSMEDEFTWVEWLRVHGDDVFGYDWWESVPNGKMLDPCIKLHLEGLKAAFESLKKDTL